MTVFPLTNLSHEPNQQSFQEVITYQNILTLLSHYFFKIIFCYFFFLWESFPSVALLVRVFFNSIVYAKCYRVKVKSSFLFPFVSQEGEGRIHQSIKKTIPHDPVVYIS